MRRRIARVVAVGVITIASGTASAGRSHFAWLYGTEVMPERGAELQSFVAEQNGQPGGLQESDWWLGAVVGITDQLELAVPIQVQWSVADGENPHTSFKYFGGELRYRFVTQDPVDAPAFAPLVRVAVLRDVTTRNDLHVEADLVASYDTGGVQLLADAGFGSDVTRDDHHLELRPGAGVSVKAAGDLRVGAEVFSTISLDDLAGSWAAVGPNVSWTHGRFWLSAAYGIGLYHMRTAPRITWGIAF